MQEEVENRTLTLVVSGTKFTGRMFKAAISKYMAHRKEKKLIEFINAMEVREDDEEFKNPVDLMFDALESEKPNHFAVRQYKKYKLAAGDICSK